MNREIKFTAELNGKIYEVETRNSKSNRKGCKGYYLENGYVERLITEHPFPNKRGYVAEHRLIMEEHLGRFLIPRKELIHHIDGNRQNNAIENLKLTTPSEHFYKEHYKARNDNGCFVATDQIFLDIKYRLFNRDTNIAQVYTLKELMSTTYRRAKFEFRGRFTGLKDRVDVSIYEGDILEAVNRVYDSKSNIQDYFQLFEVTFLNGCFMFGSFNAHEFFNKFILRKVIGNIYMRTLV